MMAETDSGWPRSLAFGGRPALDDAALDGLTVDRREFVAS